MEEFNVCRERPSGGRAAVVGINDWNKGARAAISCFGEQLR